MRNWFATLIVICPLLSIAAYGAAPGLMSAEARAQPEQFIVVTVANPQAARPGTVGGTARGYRGTGNYRVGPAAAALVSELSREYDLTSVSEWPIEQLQVHCVVFRIAPGASRDQVLESLQENDRVVIAQPLNEFSSASSEYDDPYAKLQENVRALDVVDAHRFSKGQGVKVAVIDTGVDTAHPDLAGRVEIGGNYVDTDVEALHSDRHGTQVAGLIAAAANNGIGIVGIAPEVKVLAFKACWHDAMNGAGRCNSFTLAQALAGAITARAHIINLSLIGPADPLLTALVGKAVEAKAIVVGAADPNAGPKSFPAALADVIAVTESETQNSDERVLRAPGRDLVTLVPQGHYDFASGSSLATAQVTGVIALLLERQRKLTTNGILRILQASTQEQQTAHGRVSSINACRALAQLEPARACAAHR